MCGSSLASSIVTAGMAGTSEIYLARRRTYRRGSPRRFKAPAEAGESALDRPILRNGLPVDRP